MDLFWNRGCSRNIIFGEPYSKERLLSHVDTPMANEIFDECIKGFLGSRLRLVISRRDFLERSPRVLFMMDGIVIREGSTAKIKESTESLAWLKTGNGQGSVKAKSWK